MRKQTFCICENKDADQLRGNREAGQRLCFRYIDNLHSPYFLNAKFQASSHFLLLYSLVCVGPGRKPERWFFHDAARMQFIFQTLLDINNISRRCSLIQEIVSLLKCYNI